MIICFNATTEAKKALDELMATAQFKDVSQVICMALENYQVLQLTTPPGGGVMALPLANGNQKREMAVIPATSEKASSNYPSLFALGVASTEKIKWAATPERASLSNVLPPTQWLFGQFNKFLPVKATCRALLNLSHDHSTGVLVEDATSKIADAACSLGDYLKVLDAKHDFRREDALSSAFPSSDIKSAGSRLRFGNQFVANVRQRQLEGLPAALRLMALTDSKEFRLSLTQAGANFAALSNPILDRNGDISLGKLSDEEVNFLLDHFLHAVPEEISAYTSILEAISVRANTPETVDKFLCTKFHLQITAKADADNHITQTFLATQRTGAISRMIDLGLIYREKAGLRVTYATTQRGKSFRSQQVKL